MVAEKTLELNITAELLEYYRMFDSKCYFKGLTLREEGIQAYDGALMRGGSVLGVLFFQYKALKKGISYFWINNNRNRDQHNILLNLALMPRSVFYVFPLFMTDQDVANRSPNLLQETYFVDVRDIGPLTPQWHRVEIDTTNLQATVYSEPKKVKLIPGRRMTEILKETDLISTQNKNMFDPILQSKAIPYEKVKAALRECFGEEKFRKENNIRSRQIRTWGLFRYY
jgi:hypothetical protein